MAEGKGSVPSSGRWAGQNVPVVRIGCPGCMAFSHKRGGLKVFVTVEGLWPLMSGSLIAAESTKKKRAKFGEGVFLPLGSDVCKGKTRPDRQFCVLSGLQKFDIVAQISAPVHGGTSKGCSILQYLPHVLLCPALGPVSVPSPRNSGNAPSLPETLQITSPYKTTG